MQFKRLYRAILDVVAFGVAILGIPKFLSSAEPYTVLKDQLYSKVGDVNLKADVYLPESDGPHPCVLVIHGGAWMTGAKEQLAPVARDLAGRGYTAVTISYRLAPTHKFPAQIEDCKAAVRWMRQNADAFKLDPNRLAAYGYSAGGHLAALLATTGPEDGLEGPVTEEAKEISTRPQVAVAGGAPCDFRDIPLEGKGMSFFLGGTRKEKPEAYRLASPAAFITPDDSPIFFFQGDSDFLVPARGPEAMCKALQAAGVESSIYVMKKAGHIEAFISQDARRKAIEFLDAHLKPAEEVKNAPPVEKSNAP